MRGVIAAGLLCLATAGGAETFQTRIGADTVTSDDRRQLTYVQRDTEPPRPIWIIPRAVGQFDLAPTGEAMIVFEEGGPFVPTRDGDQIIATIYRYGLPAKGYYLSTLVDPAEMPQTPSGFQWLLSMRWAGDSWILSVADGRTWRLRP